MPRDDRQSLGADQRRGRFYKIGDNQLVFMGYFQGNVEVEGGRGDLHQAGMVCPGLMEVDRTDRTQQGRAAVSSRRRAAMPSMPAGPAPGNRGGVWRALQHHRRHWEVQQGLGPEPVLDAQYGGRGGDHGPGKDVTASFTGQALWEVLKYTTP